MAIKKFSPTPPSRRYMTVVSREGITKETPEKSLTEKRVKSGGRNNPGRVTSRFISGGHKQSYRVIDFKRDKTGVPAKVSAIEYDPNRTCRIALLQYADGEKAYILAPDKLEVGATVISASSADIKPGNSLPLRHIPLGTTIHNVELHIGEGGQLARSAGTSAQLMATDGDWAQIRLPSGEIRILHLNCRASIGSIG